MKKTIHPEIQRFILKLQHDYWRKSNETSEKLLKKIKNKPIIHFARNIYSVGFKPERPEFMELLKAVIDERSKIKLDEILLSNPFNQESIKKFSNEIEEIIGKMDLKLPYIPIISTIHSGDINAIIINFKKLDEYVILFDDGLFLFFYDFSRIIGKLMQYQMHEDEMGFFCDTDVEKVRNNLESDTIYKEMFIDLIDAYLIKGDARHFNSLSLQADEVMGLYLYSDAIRLFIMGHEYAHIINNHFNQECNKKTIQTENREIEELYEIFYDWVQELKADQTGLELMMNTMLVKHKIDFSLSYGAAEIYFNICEVIERCKEILMYGEISKNRQNSKRDTHPPTFERKKMLRKFLYQSVDI